MVIVGPMTGKWLITMVIVGPLRIGLIPLSNGRFMAYKWGLLTTSSTNLNWWVSESTGFRTKHQRYHQFPSMDVPGPNTIATNSSLVKNLLRTPQYLKTSHKEYVYVYIYIYINSVVLWSIPTVDSCISYLPVHLLLPCWPTILGCHHSTGITSMGTALRL